MDPANRPHRSAANASDATPTPSPTSPGSPASPAPTTANRYAHLVSQAQSDGRGGPKSFVGPDAPRAPASASSVSAASGGQSQGQRRAYANHNYYASFSSVDWREQWITLKDKLLERVEEPQSQRRLILVIVCCALLLDNMLYMVIVPIIPDYLRSIGAWSTYTENAKWIRRNTSAGGAPKWERVGGNVVYEGEDSAVGFLFASKAIVQLFINPFSGAIIDRIGYEIPMMIGLAVMFFSTMVFACGQTYSVLFLARSLQGVGSAFADTSGLAMIADRFTEENERQRALGVALAFISFGCLVAPPFGSILYDGAGKEVPFIILSLVCLLDGSLLLLVTPPGTFAQLLPGFCNPVRPPEHPAPRPSKQAGLQPQQQEIQMEGQQGANEDRKRPLQRQKSVSRRHSMTMASAGEAPKGTPIYVLFRDPCIACCAGALVVANVSLAFLEPTISIWMRNTMQDIEEWQMGMIWLPAFVPHVLGVYSTVQLADKYPRYQWLIAAIGLVLEGLACLMVPFCTSFWSLIIPISIICFGLALIDTAILPTLGYLVDTRYVSVYGSIYAIADISYSLSYAIGPIIAGGIVEAIGFTALNFLIAIVTLGYTPILMMLRNIHDYEPFEADQAALKGKTKDELAPFGRFGRRVDEDEDDDQRTRALQVGGDFGGEGACDSGRYEASGQWAHSSQQPQSDGQAADSSARYGSPKWAGEISTRGVAGAGGAQEGPKSALAKRSSSSRSQAGDNEAAGKRHTVKIVERSAADAEALSSRDLHSDGYLADGASGRPPVGNPFLAD